ncbi:class I SAM-dependent methyltransferase [Acidiphilium sp. AL]|uniref:Class I SAM-dependent methyltransferase n=1 Tax=Acidiphilium iwatense TaxID=768198 RepID=A0ABS9E102_9PROT|nr:MULTISPECIES: class I SAM-dependent methyltransferase [Acidiphilium]MCF3948667.1 class I SAM-dependent methyltransferase [Acidiphilium iwatense]MCU4161481.1 class I SAM-dependent methyltransferase [Acidiphilium sp. AL]
MTQQAGEELWRETNRANWNERVPIHLRSKFYDIERLRAGTATLYPIEEVEFGPVADLDVLHLQCHFGYDSLVLARQGARVTGLDFSGVATTAAQDLARELDLAERATFVEADLYDAQTAIGPHRRFDRVFVTWGALVWLPDITRWAEIVSGFLKPGGRLYLADGHPFAYLFDEHAAPRSGPLKYYAPYFGSLGIRAQSPIDYADAEARLTNATTFEFLHTLGDIITAVTKAGLTLDYLHEHPTVPWQMFDCLVEDERGMFHWPDQRWLPLAFSISARRE